MSEASWCGMEARSNNPQQGPGAEAREIFEIFTSPDLWKSLFHRLKTLGFELLKPLKSVKPVHLKKMGKYGNAGECRRDFSRGDFSREKKAKCGSLPPKAGGLATM